MVWARFDDRYSECPKVEMAGPWAELLDMRAIIYCARNETDGLVTVTALGKVAANIPNPRGKAARLVEVGRWKVNDTGGWFVHDFLEFNPSKAQLNEQRAKTRDRQAKHRESARNAVTRGVTNASPRSGRVSLEPKEDVRAVPPPWVQFGMSRQEWVLRERENERTA